MKKKTKQKCPIRGHECDKECPLYAHDIKGCCVYGIYQMLVKLDEGRLV